MLPQIFRPDNPLLQLSYSREYRLKLEKLLDSLDPSIFIASDALGWVYQFWQKENKRKINESEVKIGAQELPAVTQLFTEPYMVSFLLDNALGAWWAARRLTEDDFKNATGEEDLRRQASIPGVPLEYLRFVQLEDGRWTPAAGTFDRWPASLAELKTLDPCCGSGHFLVAAFLMLVPMRMELEHLTEKEAVNAVLRENIHGLELDLRCVELAAFALALTAWKYPNAGGYRPLPELHLACSGLSVSVAKEEWKQLGLGKKNLTLALDWMHDVFRDAPILGSLLNPANTDAAKLVQWEELSTALEQALKQEQTEEQQEAAVVAQGLAKAAILLAGKYQWVITNVPYLARGKQIGFLQDFSEKNYPAAKNDLATVFLDRCIGLCVEGGTASIVLPQNWLFLTSYKKFREKLLTNDTWHLIARLGPGAFETISGEVVKAILITLSRGNPGGNIGGLFGEEILANTLCGVDVSASRSTHEKALGLSTSGVKSVEQANQLKNPDSIVNLDSSESQERLSQYASCYQGTSTGDNPRYVNYFWETNKVVHPFEMMEGVPSETMPFGGKQAIIKWSGVASSSSSAVRGWDAFGKKGVSIGQMSNLPATLYLGGRFPNTTPVIIPTSPDHLAAIWTFCSSSCFCEELRKINQKLSVDNGYVGKIPFDINFWSKAAKEQYPVDLPKPYSNDPSQWLYHGHPTKSDAPLQVSIARLLGYRWPAELDSSMELSEGTRSLVKKCEHLHALADDDGIVCLPAVRKEDSAADRLAHFLSVAFGSEWSPGKERELLAAAGAKATDLDDWLRNEFFEQHCKLFGHRPFIWHIWDGRKRDGFHALVNYHELAEGNGKGRKLLETLTYSYLGDWIIAQHDGVKQGIGGAEERLAAAQELEKRLKAILDGEPPYDIFVRWKPIEEQAIGWEPDIKDGIRLNIRPFLVDDIPGGKTGAGILRWTPNINWDKNKGKDAPSTPWYRQFKGERINDHHLTNDEKRAAREAALATKGEKS